ncbi:MAG: hypothetical protein JSV00_03545 [bacterium]|nr:MAG: hypothetical protein JSV00_03545 [bacterium]
MKKIVIAVVVGPLLAAVLPAASWGINPGAHIYVTGQVFESEDLDLLYGSIAPDISLYVPDPVAWPTGFMDTHYTYARLWPMGWEEDWKRFALGWMVHNEEWGADYTAHIQYPVGSGNPGYVVQKAAILAPFIPVPDPFLRMEIAHNAIEFAIDVLVQESMDPLLGVKLHVVNLSRSDRDIHGLFNVLVARGKATDRDTLFQSEQVFREIVHLYSGALASSNLLDMAPLAQVGAALAQELYGVDIPWTEVLALLELSVWLCFDDFAPFIEDTVQGIRDTLDAQ